MLLAALAILFPASDRSLGIGIDVLPEAYTFAAHRVGFVADLRLTTCTASQCVWTLGDGVRIAADHTHDSLDIYRIEASVDRASAGASAAAARYENACTAIVALVEQDASPREVHAAADALLSAPGNAPHRMRVDTPTQPVSLYRVPAAAPTRPAERCGAIAAF